MRKIIRFLFALILGFIAFEAVDLWPVRPMWSKPGEKTSIIGLSADERILYLVQGITQQDHYDKDSKLSFVKCDLQTGLEIDRTEFSVAANFETAYFSHDAEFKTLLICGAKFAQGHENERGEISWDYHYCLLDTKTGQPLCDCRDCGDRAAMQLSPDGRWIWSTITKLNEKTSFVPSETIGRIISTLDGKVVFQTDSCNPNGDIGQFSEDSSKIAWLALDSRQEHFLLRVASIASGKLLGECLLPWKGARLTCPWKAGTIYVTKDESTEKLIAVGIQDFRLSEGKISTLENKPLLHDTFVPINEMFFCSGNTIVQWRLDRAAWSEMYLACIDWCDSHFNTTWAKSLPDRTTFRFYDRSTLRRLVDISLNDCQWAADVLSDSGRYFLSLSGQPKLLQVWDISSPRWPWALAASLSTLVVVLLFGRWRYKRVNNSR